MVVFLVLECIKSNYLNQRQIIKKTKLSERTVRYAIKGLISKGIIKEELNIEDLRNKYYQIS